MIESLSYDTEVVIKIIDMDRYLNFVKFISPGRILRLLCANGILLVRPFNYFSVPSKNGPGRIPRFYRSNKGFVYDRGPIIVHIGRSF